MVRCLEVDVKESFMESATLPTVASFRFLSKAMMESRL